MYAPSVETNPHLGIPRPSSVQSHGFAAQNPCPTSGLPAHIKLWTDGSQKSHHLQLTTMPMNLKRQALDHPCWIEVLQFILCSGFKIFPNFARVGKSPLLTSSNTRNPTLAMVITPRSMKSVRRPCVFPHGLGCSPILTKFSTLKVKCNNCPQKKNCNNPRRFSRAVGKQ